MRATQSAERFWELSRAASIRAGVEVRDASHTPLSLLMAWREEVLRDVFELSPKADLSCVMAANRATYEKALAAGSIVPCFAWPTTATPPSAPQETRSQAASPAQDQGEPVATGILCFQEELPSPDNPHGACGYLMNIYTRPAWRGRGVGRAVVAWLCAQALEHGVGKLSLETTPAARPLYESLGFSDMVDYLKL